MDCDRMDSNGQIACAFVEQPPTFVCYLHVAGVETLQCSYSVVVLLYIGI